MVLTEVPDYWLRLNQSDDQWLGITNRLEKHVLSPGESGVSILGDFTSMLRSAQHFPLLSKMLFARAIERFAFNFKRQRKASENPIISYVIGHRGQDKVPNLQTVIQSIAGQHNDAVECIVVEQSSHSQASEQLPDWVNYHHLQVDESALYNRSLSFNYGVEQARGKYLVLHDNDLLVPACYTDEHLKYFDQGYELVNLKRFIFGLNQADSHRICTNRKLQNSYIPDYVMQNAKGGGSLVISRQAYERIGGFDNRFEGWGAEDNELWQRAQILNIYPFSNLPLIHLWHKPQSDKRGGKQGGGYHTEQLMGELSDVSIYNRINSLRAKKLC